MTIFMKNRVIEMTTFFIPYLAQLWEKVGPLRIGGGIYPKFYVEYSAYAIFIKWASLCDKTCENSFLSLNWPI